MARFNKSFCMLKSRLSTTIIRQQKWPEVNPGEQHQDVKRQYFFDLIHVYELNIRIKVAPRVEKRKLRSSKIVEILQIRLILRFGKWKNIIFYYGWKKQHFFPHIFTNEIIFYSTELFVCAVNFKFYLIIFMFLNVTQIKHQKSNT